MFVTVDSGCAIRLRVLIVQRRAKHVGNLTDQILQGRGEKVSNIVLERKVGMLTLCATSDGTQGGGGGYD
jgi:hypothetical protein